MASAFGDPMAPSPCEQCGNEGTMRCSVRDNKNLCQGCFQDLPQERREDIGDPEWVCHIHLNRKVDIFCETCQRGCCRECAVDVHQDHNVENVLKLKEEIRRDLTKLLHEVGVRAERLSELRPKIESSLQKVEEPPKLFDQFVDEIKHEIAHNLEKELHSNLWETHFNMIPRERRKEIVQELAIEKADLNNQRILEIQRGISPGLLEDAEKRRCKMQKAESKLLVGQQACVMAKLQIKSMLESTPEKLVCEGRLLGSLVKASCALQCQNDVLESCREVEADLPQLKMEKDFFFHGFGRFSQFLKIVLFIYVVFSFARFARVGYRDEYNRLLSSESMTSFIMLCLYFPMYHATKCVILTLLLAYTYCMYDYPIKRQVSFLKNVTFCIKLVLLALGLWLLTFPFLILVSSPLYLFQMEPVSANSVSIISILQSCSFLYGMLNSKTFKDCCDYKKLYKF
eukprot:XP_011673911.1 PREDICTED: uncharacterized protein LOC105442932 [Strongylocentrotus purpuratus]